MTESRCSALKIADSNDCNRSDRDGDFNDGNNVAERQIVKTSESKSRSEIGLNERLNNQLDLSENVEKVTLSCSKRRVRIMQTNADDDNGGENTNLNGLFSSNAIADENIQTSVTNVSSVKTSSNEEYSVECKNENRNNNSKPLVQKTGRQYGKRKKKRNAKRSSGSIDANTSAIDQSKLEDVKMMIENWTKSGELKEKTEIQKMEFFRKSVDQEILETMKCIDPERKIDSLDALFAKVNTLLLPQKKPICSPNLLFARRRENM